MPQYTPEQLYAAARALLPSLDPALRRQVETLLAQAEGGADTHLRLLDQLTEDDATRERLRALLKGEETVPERGLGEYSDLGGEIYPTKAGDVFACPECGYRVLVGEDGEQPPPCEKHPETRLVKEPPKEK